MKKLITLFGIAAFALALIGCGSSDSETAGESGKDVKQLPATAPVSSEQQAAAKAAVANDPKAETPRPDGQ